MAKPPPLVASSKQESIKPSLPPTAWAAAFDFLPYKDVRLNLLISRLFAKEVPSHIETLSIFQPWEMDVPSARRFANVRNVQVFCVVIEKELQVAALERVIHYLQAFSHLTSAFIGAGESSWNTDRYPYDMLLNDTYHHPDRDVFRGFMRDLCTCFKMRALARDIDIECIETYDDDAYLCPEDEDENILECSLCKDIFRHFPLKIACSIPCGCTSYAERLELISKRPGAIDYLQSPKHLERILQQSLTDTEDYSVYFISRSGLLKIKALISYGSNPRDVDMNIITQDWLKYNMYYRTSGFPFAKCSMSILKHLGFNIQPIHDNKNIRTVEKEESTSLCRIIGDIEDEYEDLF